jgi:tetratricopeptide (TPR) repeat protein
MPKIFQRLFVFFSFGLILIGLAFCTNSPSNKKVEENTLASLYLNHSDTAKYVGITTCKLCHQDIYNSFIKTGMGKSFDVATKLKSSAKFDKHTAIYDKYRDFYYHPFWKNDSLYILEFRLKGKDTIYQHSEKVDYIIGSGQHTNSHIYNTNGYLHQMPMTYYTQQGKWDFPPGFENGFNTRFSRKIGLECMSCHNSFPTFVKGSENKFEKIPNGINCERCHGPGSIHVAQRSTGSKIDTSNYIDYSIVNPGKLPIDLQFDICQRCHLQGNTVLKEGKSFFDFKPGKKLSDYMTTFLPRYKNADDEFIMASHADRLKQSKCFIKSMEKAEKEQTKNLKPYKNALTCVTCHNPHISVKETGKEVFNDACKNCHNETKQTITCSEKPETLKLKENNCVSCHIPKSGSIDIPHVTVHDHYIRKPIKQKQIDAIKTFVGLYAINEKSPSIYTKAKAYLQQYEKFEFKQYYLDSAQALLSDKSKESIIKNFELLVQLYFVKQDYNRINQYVEMIGKEKILNELLNKQSYENTHAWALYRIGESFFNLGNYSSANSFFKKADELAPFNPEFKNKLGTSLMALNKTNEAINVFEKIKNEDNKFVPALNNLGYAYLISGKVNKAEATYNIALSLDPDYESLLMNVVGYNVYTKNYSEAKNILNRILLKNPENEKAKMVLNQIKYLK